MTVADLMEAKDAHVLNRPIWAALTGRQSGFAEEAAGIRRYGAAFAPFAASADGSAESLAGLAALVPAGSVVVLQQERAIAPPPGLTLVRAALTVQMVATEVASPPPGLDYAPLSAADAPEMLDLALLTKPGPFAARTHELGHFIGIRREGRLVAMAGERMKPGRFTEVSGVCTHPEFRGRGYAAGLLQAVARAIIDRGETPFLHAFADNHGAIGLYERLGFVTRWEPMLMVFGRN